MKESFWESVTNMKVVCLLYKLLKQMKTLKNDWMFQKVLLEENEAFGN